VRAMPASTTRPRAEPDARHDRILPWIAAERGFRALVLLTVGAVLVSRPHTDWAGEISHLAQRLGLDPRENGIRKLIDKVRTISPHEDIVFGVIALAYGALEATEAYGLWRRRRWGEWLTVVATSLFLIPEVWALSKGATALKLGGLLVNLLVVAYLLWRLRRTRQPSPRADDSPIAGPRRR
jgi:uncharacterized membrane protein (DUF2068 family)